MKADFEAAGQRLLESTKTALKGIVELDASSQARIRSLGSRVAEIQLLALSDPKQAAEQWPIVEASLQQWKSVALGRSEEARLRMRSAVKEFFSSTISIALAVLEKAF